MKKDKTAKVLVGDRSCKASAAVREYDPIIFGEDEETDLEKYVQYVARMTTHNLCDVRRHIDECRFPARADVIRRELARRVWF